MEDDISSINRNQLNYNELEHEFNVLNPNYNIPSPLETQIRKNLFIINSNNNIKYKIENKIILNEGDIIRIKNSGEGNCYFKCIIQIYINQETLHIYYRKIICELISAKINIDKINYPYAINNNNEPISYLENFNNIIKTGYFAGQYEIINSCIKLNCNVCIYRLITKLKIINNLIIFLRL